MRYALQQYENNKERASFWVDSLLPNIGHWPSDKTSREGERLKGMLTAIPGVHEVSASEYHISFRRGGTYTWDELKPQIAAAVQKFFNVDEMQEVTPFA